MRFSGTVDIGAPRERVWEFVTDPLRVGRCAPDVRSIEARGPDRFNVVARAGLGPVRATFTLDVTFTELRPPEHAVVRVRGQAPGSAVDMTNTVDLDAAASGGTTLRWASDVAVSGTIASVGARFLPGAADALTKQVFACVKEQLEA